MNRAPDHQTQSLAIKASNRFALRFRCWRLYSRRPQSFKTTIARTTPALKLAWPSNKVPLPLPKDEAELSRSLSLSRLDGLFVEVRAKLRNTAPDPFGSFAAFRPAIRPIDLFGRSCPFCRCSSMRGCSHAIVRHVQRRGGCRMGGMFRTC